MRKSSGEFTSHTYCSAPHFDPCRFSTNFRAYYADSWSNIPFEVKVATVH
jgi:hypothetical protein